MTHKRVSRQAELPLPSIGQTLEPSPHFHGIAAMECVKRLLRENGRSLDELAEWMSAPSRRSRPLAITTARAWFADSRPDHWPTVRDMTLICEFLNDPSPLNLLIEHLGWRVVGRREQRLLCAAEIQAEEIRQNHKADEAARILTSVALEDERGGGKRK